MKHETGSASIAEENLNCHLHYNTENFRNFMWQDLKTYELFILYLGPTQLNYLLVLLAIRWSLY